MTCQECAYKNSEIAFLKNELAEYGRTVQRWTLAMEREMALYKELARVAQEAVDHGYWRSKMIEALGALKEKP